ncbi:MAG: restriction endonuclease [Deltaproteobacteria bacterium]|nr:restriction endonuclease [Deltaproteobacteria bacterium]
MLVVVLVVAPILGLLLILLIARFSPNAAQEADGARDELPEITPDEFADLVQEVVTATGLKVVFSALGTGGVLEMTVRDPRPLAGGRMVVHATPVLRNGKIDAADVLSFADGVRSEPGTLKGMFFALAGFTEEAQSAQRSSPGNVDLIDGPRLLELVTETLGAERADALRKFRGFDPVRRAARKDRLELEDLGQRPT